MIGAATFASNAAVGLLAFLFLALISVDAALYVISALLTAAIVIGLDHVFAGKNRDR